MTNETKYALGACVIVVGVGSFMLSSALQEPLQNPAQVLAVVIIVFGGGILFRSAKAEIQRRALNTLTGKHKQ